MLCIAEQRSFGLSSYSENNVADGCEYVPFVALADSGRLLSCGSNAFGQLGIGHKPPFTAELQVVEVIYFSLCITQTANGDRFP